MGYEGASASVKPVFPIINAVLPQVSLFDLGGRAVNFNWGPVSIGVVGFLLAYAACYSTVMLFIGWFKFKRQAV